MSLGVQTMFEVLESADGRHHKIAVDREETECGRFRRERLRQLTTLGFRWCGACAPLRVYDERRSPSMVGRT